MSMHHCTNIHNFSLIEQLLQDKHFHVLALSFHSSMEERPYLYSAYVKRLRR